jgi:hypothetical protein
MIEFMSLTYCRSRRDIFPAAQFLTVCGKSAFTVIPFTVSVHGEPNEVRNLSGFECLEKEGFLGTQRASE